MIPQAPFGRTGHRSTRVIFGAAALGAMSQERADATLAAIDRAGINHIDTAASYGESEDRLKPWLAEVNGKLSGYEQLQMFVIADQPWTIENGLLTPTMKIKRHVVATMYHDLIDTMYEEAAAHVAG